MKRIFALTASTVVLIAGAALAQDIPVTVHEYVIAHPADPIVIEDDLAEGFFLPERVVVNPIPENPAYGYIYVDGQPVIVELDSRQVVYLHEAEVPNEAITYIQKHPLDPVTVDSEVQPGTIIPDGVPLTPLPDRPNYAYLYVDGIPVLVNMASRTVVWVEE
ncbi:MAG: DUF1236 domain-containing protein [Phyllobacterium sp.]